MQNNKDTIDCNRNKSGSISDMYVQDGLASLQSKFGDMG